MDVRVARRILILQPSMRVWRKLASVAVDVSVLVKQGSEPLAAGRCQFGPNDLLVVSDNGGWLAHRILR
jgi:hypothetical protein